MSAVIIEFQAENFKKLKAVRIMPKGSKVVISGKNDQGKSCVIDSLIAVLFGEKAICAEPIREGEKRARVFIKLSEELNSVMTAERKFTPSGTTLEIRNADGVVQKSPQALLDALTGKISYDPLHFVRLDKQKQMELLQKLVGLDFTELNATRATAFGERTIRNRELDQAKVRLAGYPFDPSLPKEPVSIQDLALKLGDAKSKNGTRSRRKSEVEKQKQQALDLLDDVERLREKVKALEDMIRDTKAQIDAKLKSSSEAVIEAERMATEFATLETVDESSLQKQIDDIQKTNASIEANNRYLKAQDDVALLEGTVKGLADKIKECDEDKAAQIEFAQFPMPGLSFDEERGVLLNGTQFKEGSTAKQFIAATAIGLALNPKLKIIPIRDGSLLDDDSMAKLSEMVEAAGAMLWVEVVNSKDPAAIVIEDGEVAENPIKTIDDQLKAITKTL